MHLRFALFLIAAATFAQTAQLPTTLLTPTVPAITGTNRTVCASGCDFTTPQAAVTAATCGDGITITAGQTFTGTITLPNKACVGSILIRSSAFASLPATGVRANCAGDLANMPKLQVTANNTAVLQNDITNVTPSARAAHDYYMLGLNITLGAAVTSNFGLVTFGTGGNIAGAPSNITLDRSCVHPDHNAVGAQDFVRGVSLEGSRPAVINSTVQGFSSPNAQADSQAILVYGGPGVCKISNNYLDAASEIMMFGGTNGGLQANQVSDCEISYNYFKKQAAWATAGTNAKNCLEFKTGVRMWAHDNLFEDCYSNVSQSGACVLFTNRPSQSGYGTTENNVTYQGNICRHAGQAVQILGSDDFCGQLTSTINTTGTAFTITAGTQGNIKFGQVSPLPVTVNGVANTILSFSDATHGVLSASPGNLTGAALQTVYSQCATQSNIVITNNLFDDISDAFNGGFTEIANLLLYEQYTNYNHNTLVIGTNSFGSAISYFFENAFTPSLIAVSVNSNISVTTNYGAFASGAGNDPAAFLVPPNTSVYMNLNGNLPAGLSGSEPASWGMVGTGNQFPANYAAIGLLSDNKSLDPMSTYFSTGAGANLETCFDETAITNGTVPDTSCVTAGGTRISGAIRITGGVVIH